MGGVLRGPLRTLDRVIEVTLSLGLLSSLLLLMVGLPLRDETLLRAGIVILMFTPVVRVVVVTIGLFHERDWPFAAISTFVLGVILSGIAVAARL